MNPAQPFKTSLPLVATCVLLTASVALAQPMEPGSEVYQSAVQFFKNHADEVTARNALDYEWFHGFRGVSKETNAGFEVVAHDLPVGKGPRFSLAGSKARPGDMIRVDWTHKGDAKSSVFIYAGEESFPDRDAKHSFFIYPYRTRLEYNTVPARKHRQYLLHLELNRPVTLDLLYNFVPDPTRATKGEPTQWMQKSVWADNLYTRTTMLNGSGRYAIYRAKGDDYIALQREMVFHRQLKDESCFFAAYADVATYKGLNPYGKTSADARDYELALIRDEIIRPANDDRRRAAAFFRTVVFQRDQAKDDGLRTEKDPDKKKYAWSSPRDERLTALLRRGYFLGDWWACAYGLRWKSYHLEDIYPNGIAPEAASLSKFKTDFLATVRENLRNDGPVMITIAYAGWSNLFAPGGTQKPHVWEKYGHVGVVIDPKPEVGHWLKVTGLRRDGDKWYVHFCATMGEEKGGKFFVELENLLQCMPRRAGADAVATGQQYWLQIPDDWKVGDAVPMDEASGLKTGGYVPFLARLTGKPVQVRQARPD
jgi:hypothetical protein